MSMFKKSSPRASLAAKSFPPNNPGTEIETPVLEAAPWANTAVLGNEQGPSPQGIAVMEHDGFKLRDTMLEDVSAIADIWRRGTSASLGFEVDFQEAEQYFCQCILEQSDASKFWVATDHAGKVLGWQSLCPTRANPILRNLVAESSTYVDPCCVVRGVGTALIRMASQYADKSSLLYLTGYSRNIRMRSIVLKAGWIEIGSVPPSTKVPIVPAVGFFIYVAKAQ